MLYYNKVGPIVQPEFQWRLSPWNELLQHIKEAVCIQLYETSISVAIVARQAKKYPYLFSSLCQLLKNSDPK